MPSRELLSSSPLTLVTWGRSSISAISGPTWLVSPSTLLRPQTIRSNPSRRKAIERARGGGQRIGAREGAVDQVNASVAAHGQALHDGLPGLRRAQGHHYHLALQRLPDAGRRGHPEHVEGVDLAGHLLADDSLGVVVEL